MISNITPPLKELGTHDGRLRRQSEGLKSLLRLRGAAIWHLRGLGFVGALSTVLSCGVCDAR